MLFKLIGHTTVFYLVSQYKVCDIRCVYGRTLDDKRQACARIADIEIVPDTILAR